ncbi:MAG: GntR family transcriptional regulator [Bacilli bacterium]|jgi:DNA-binding transcriptional regulator YhcF (GntR family)|nr:GntR family transcriptional regulator [Bacilli bacterium]
MQFNNKQPIYMQIIEYIIIDIINGKYIDNNKLPSVREIALALQVNPNTIQKAYTELESLDIIYTKRNSGSFVKDDNNLINKLKKELLDNKTKEYLDYMEKLGINKEEIINYIKEM